MVMHARMPAERKISTHPRTASGLILVRTNPRSKVRPAGTPNRKVS